MQNKNIWLSKQQNETKIWIEQDCFKQGSILDWKIVETFLGDGKLWSTGKCFSDRVPT